MRGLLPLLIALPATLVAGYLHGRMTDRWGTASAVAEAASLAASLPLEIGDWRGQPEELPRSTIEMAGIAGYAMRRYRDPATGRAVSVLLVCGRPGPIAAHTPEVCYPGAGFEPQGRASRREAGDHGEFFVQEYGKPGIAGPESLRICWAWNDGSGWQTSEAPRARFAGRPYLYKLYLVSEASQPGAIELQEQFLGVLLPEIREVLRLAGRDQAR